MSDTAMYERALRVQRAEALFRAFHRRGIHLRLVGGSLRWFARVGVITADDLDELERRKPEVLNILRKERHLRGEERGAVIQFDAGQSRAQVDRQAMA